MKLAKQIEEKAGNWPEWFRTQMQALKQWKRGWPIGSIILPLDVPYHVIFKPLWVPDGVGIIGHPCRGHRRPESTFLSCGRDFKGEAAIRVMRPFKKGKQKDFANANFDQQFKNLLILCHNRAAGIDFSGAQCSSIIDVRVHNPLNYGVKLYQGSRNVRIEGLDVNADYKEGMKVLSQATGIIIDLCKGGVTGTANLYGVGTGIKVRKSKGVALIATTENVEHLATVDGATVPGGGRRGGRNVDTFDLRVGMQAYKF